MFQRTTAINKLLALKKRKRVVQGGTWAGKTYGIIPCMTNKGISNPRKKSTVVAESIPAIKQGALSNFQEMMADTQRWDDQRYNSTERTYTFLSGSTIQFTSFDSVSKAKAAGKRTDLLINEGNYIPFEIADALMMRTSETIWVDFNPTEEFWAHTELLTQDDSEFLLLKYTDNEAIPESILKELDIKLNKAYFNPYLPYIDRVKKENIKSEYWHNYCKVYIDGEIGSLEGLIFSDVKVVPEFPSDCTWIIHGLDFGYTNHPSSLIKIGLHNGFLFFDQLFYKPGLTNQDIAVLMKQNSVTGTIVADSAEPKSIEELRRMGFNVVGAVKGKDSINVGIDLLQRYAKFITASSIDTIKEFRSYKWKIDKITGKATNIPEDEFNHSMDAIRYAVWYKLSNQGGGLDYAIL